MSSRARRLSALLARVRVVLLTGSLAACGGAGHATLPEAGGAPVSVAVSVGTPAPSAHGGEPARVSAGRPVVVVFGAAWASGSRVLAERTLADPRVKAALADVDFSYVDATDSDDPKVAAALAREQVAALPCIVVHAARDQTAREYLNGFVTAEVLLAALDRASR